MTKEEFQRELDNIKDLLRQVTQKYIRACALAQLDSVHEQIYNDKPRKLVVISVEPYSGYEGGNFEYKCQTYHEDGTELGITLLYDKFFNKPSNRIVVKSYVSKRERYK